MKESNCRVWAGLKKKKKKRKEQEGELRRQYSSLSAEAVKSPLVFRNRQFRDPVFQFARTWRWHFVGDFLRDPGVLRAHVNSPRRIWRRWRLRYAGCHSQIVFAAKLCSLLLRRLSISKENRPLISRPFHAACDKLGVSSAVSSINFSAPTCAMFIEIATCVGGIIPFSGYWRKISIVNRPRQFPVACIITTSKCAIIRVVIDAWIRNNTPTSLRCYHDCENATYHVWFIYLFPQCDVQKVQWKLEWMKGIFNFVA